MDYDKLMQEEIKNLTSRPTLLLHSCCAPCSSAVIKRLKDHFNLTVYYYNPNIEPIEEYEKRKTEQIKLLNIYNIPYLESIYENDLFNKTISGLENEIEGGMRCHKCYKLRLKKTVLKALKEDYEYYSTTLTISPHKNSKIINEIGLALSKEYNIKYLVNDFKKREGYKQSIELSKEYELYRQDYCGCKSSFY